jgi:threonine synthase
MTTFLSTRGPPATSLRNAVSEGLAPDGGLYVPLELRAMPTPAVERTASFQDTARAAARWLLPDVPALVTDRLASEAFDFAVPLVEVEPDVHVLELFHGPTHAFKDIGARFMARLMRALDSGVEARTVLVATSGDTGGAVAHAFAGLPRYRVVVLFPQGGVSESQRRQMTTLGGNVVAVAVDGTFDDCQALAKAAFLDGRLSGRHGLTSANSINIGRLLPQTIYYIHAAAMLGWSERPARFAVPCGNLGNLFAGLFAHRSGMPAAGFVAATNSNRIFVDYLASGVVHPRPSVATASSAMDVTNPSNLERIRWLYRNDPATLRKHVSGACVSDAETHDCIADVHARTGYVLDPHSAVAYRAQQQGTTGEHPTVVLATAHPAKFPGIVERAIGRSVPLPPGIAAVMDAEERMERIRPTLTELSRVLGGARRE